MSAGIPMGAMPPPPGGVAQPPAGAGGVPMRPPQPAPPAGGSSPASGLFLLLSFLAGSGLDKAVNSISKIAKLGQAPTADPNRAHRGGIRLDAANNPGMTIAPQMAQMLAAKAGQQPNGSDQLVSLLAKALQMQVGPGGAGGSPIGKLG